MVLTFVGGFGCLVRKFGRLDDEGIVWVLGFVVLVIVFGCSWECLCFGFSVCLCFF